MKKNIKLSVALPLYRAEHIAWLSIESLCRQSNIDFEWELLIAEEIYKEAIGLTRINEFRNRLSKVGCHRMEYIPLKKWIPLSTKWKLLANKISKSSKYFLLQSADCYSNNNRLTNTVKLFDTTGGDWVQSQTHLIYDIINDNFYTFGVKGHKMGADMAVKTSLIKNLPTDGTWRSVDFWMYSMAQKEKGSPLEITWDNSDNWSRSLNVHGLNNISERTQFFGNILELVDNPKRYIKNFPPEILKKVKNCRRYALKRKLIKHSI